jgi:hypothetical protein
MKAQYYVVHNPDTNDACLSWSDTDQPNVFDTEADAVEDAKSLPPSLVLKTVMMVSQKRSFKIDRAR